MSRAFKHVMCVRREGATRLEGFIDASFAFAITLVVISIGRVPTTVNEMLTALHGLPTFAVCFLLLVRIWLAHRDFGRFYDLDDTTTLRLSLLLVFVVLIYVYPLRMLFAQMFLGLSNGWLSDGDVVPLDTPEQLRMAYIVFALGLGAISLVFALLLRHALRQRDAIGLTTGEVLWTRMKIARWGMQFVLCLLSIALALCMPLRTPLSIAAPGLIYAASLFVQPWIERHFERRYARLGGAPA